MNKPKKLNLKLLSYAVLAAFIISLIPLIVISFYNYPAADDFSYGRLPAHAWEQSHSLIQTLNSSLIKTGQSYENWQGTFSAIFLMALQPAIWGEGYYWLATIILLGALILSSMLFFYTVLRKWLKLDKHLYLIIGLILTAACIQFVPSPAQAFYWYNGSIYYTFFYSLSLTAVSLLFIGEWSTKKSVRIACWIFAGLLFFIIGSGNYVTSLITIIIAFLITAYAFWKKRHMRWTATICLILCITAFAVSALAPGNAVRQEALGATMSPINAILQSFKHAFTNFGAWTTAPILLLFLFIAPFLYIAASKAKCSFRLPLLWIGLAFCILAAHFTPTLYAMQKPGAGRVTNIIFYYYILFMAFSIFYISGWVHLRLCKDSRAACQSRTGNTILPHTVSSVQLTAAEIKLSEAAPGSNTSESDPCENSVQANEQDGLISAIILVSHKCAAGIIIAFILLFGLTIFGQKGFKSLTSYSATHSLISGEAAVYKAEQEDRLTILKDNSIKDAVLKPLSCKPAVLFFDDITTDSSNWRNKDIAAYYKKDSVILAP